MKRSKHKLWIVWLIALLICAMAGASKAAPAQTEAQQDNDVTRILVFETTDIHGYLVDTSSGNEDTYQYRMAYIAQVVNDARAMAAGKAAGDAACADAFDDVLLIDGGDIYQGTPVSNLLEGSALRAALDYMDYDAVVLGNHEFDWGVTEYAADENGTIPEYELGGPANADGAAATNFDTANADGAAATNFDTAIADGAAATSFDTANADGAAATSFDTANTSAGSFYLAGDPDIPVLASNLYYEKNGKRVNFTKDYVIVEKAGLRIALVGYIPDYSSTILTENSAPYEIDDSLQYLNTLTKIINALEKPDVTIVMTHTDPELVAEAMDPGQVALVTGGHSHLIRFGYADNGIPYMQANCKAQGYCTAVITVDSAGNVTVEDSGYTSITEDKTLLYDTWENAGRLDDSVMAISHAALDQLGGELNEVLGYIDTPVDRTETGDNGATYAGNWLTGLMLRAMEDKGVVAAIYNSGGIRTSLLIPYNQSIRQVTVGDIFTINPFCNTYLVFELTGEELAEQLEKSLKNESAGNQVSGLTFRYSQSDTEDNTEYTILSITLDDGTEIDIHDNKTKYRICTTNYISTKRYSVFYEKVPVFPESEAPVDNITLIETLRKVSAENNGYIPVDTSPRGILVE